MEGAWVWSFDLDSENTHKNIFFEFSMDSRLQTFVSMNKFSVSQNLSQVIEDL